jgi:ethanolamine-phosphate cytidylyltransferase
VDDILIDAPYVITNEMIASLHITVVARSLPGTMMNQPTEAAASSTPLEEEDPYELPKKLEILKTIYINHTITAMDFVERIQEQQERYTKRYMKKMEAEKEFYKNKYSL